jgi:hypothetical protein
MGTYLTWHALKSLWKFVEAVSRMDQQVARQWLAIPDGTRIPITMPSSGSDQIRSFQKTGRRMIQSQESEASFASLHIMVTTTTQLSRLAQGQTTFPRACANGSLMIIGPAPMAMALINAIEGSLPYMMRMAFFARGPKERTFAPMPLSKKLRCLLHVVRQGRSGSE